MPITLALLIAGIVLLVLGVSAPLGLVLLAIGAVLTAVQIVFFLGAILVVRKRIKNDFDSFDSFFK